MQIKEAQKQIHEFILSKGWDKQPLSVDTTFLAEETGEVAREVLHLEVPHKDEKSKEQALNDLGHDLQMFSTYILVKNTA